MTTPALAFTDLNNPFIIYLDTSYYCTGTVLSQEHEIEGKIRERHIGYVANQFCPTHLKYAVTEKEAYTVYHALKNIHPYPYIYIEK